MIDWGICTKFKHDTRYLECGLRIEARVKSKWSCERVLRKENLIPENEMAEKLADVWELLQSLELSPPARSLPKADKPIEVKDSDNKRSAS